MARERRGRRGEGGVASSPARWSLPSGSVEGPRPAEPVGRGFVGPRAELYSLASWCAPGRVWVFLYPPHVDHPTRQTAPERFLSRTISARLAAEPRVKVRTPESLEAVHGTVVARAPFLGAWHRCRQSGFLGAWPTSGDSPRPSPKVPGTVVGRRCSFCPSMPLRGTAVQGTVPRTRAEEARLERRRRG